MKSTTTLILGYVLGMMVMSLVGLFPSIRSDQLFEKSRVGNGRFEAAWFLRPTFAFDPVTNVLKLRESEDGGWYDYAVISKFSGDGPNGLPKLSWSRNSLTVKYRSARIHHFFNTFGSAVGFGQQGAEILLRKIPPGEPQGSVPESD